MNKWDKTTCAKQARTEGIGARQVRVNEHFAKGIDTIKEVAPNLADKILKPKPDQNDQVNVEEMGLSDHRQITYRRCVRYKYPFLTEGKLRLKDSPNLPRSPGVTTTNLEEETTILAVLSVPPLLLLTAAIIK